VAKIGGVGVYETAMKLTPANCKFYDFKEYNYTWLFRPYKNIPF
jgi:hypothetical protein